MSLLIRGMEMPSGCLSCDFCNPFVDEPYCRRLMRRTPKVTRLADCPLVHVPSHGILRKRLVYRGEVYNALEAERVNSLDGILTDHYKDGFHDGLKRALQILAEVEDAPTIIEAEEE